MVSVLNGAIGGIVATAVMTAVMLAFGPDSPPPTAALWAKYVGDGDPAEHKGPGMVLHFLYGAISGALYVPIFTAVGVLALTSWVGGVVWGLVWGLALFVVAATLWLNVVLGMDPDRSTALFMGANHLVYGVVLGLWVALGLL